MFEQFVARDEAVAYRILSPPASAHPPTKGQIGTSSAATAPRSGRSLETCIIRPPAVSNNPDLGLFEWLATRG
jgi:hypothetical protein